MALEDENQPGSDKSGSDKCNHYGVRVASGSLTVLFGMLTALFTRDLILDFKNDSSGSAKASDGALLGVFATLTFIALCYLIKNTCGPSLARCSATLFNNLQVTQPGLPYTVQDDHYSPAPD